MSELKFFRIFGDWPYNIIEPPSDDDDIMDDIMFAERAEEDKWDIYYAQQGV